MDRKILLVESEIDSTKALKNKQMVSFHKQPRICLNADVLGKTGIYAGMYAQYAHVDFRNRRIYINIVNVKPTVKPTSWYKITNPQIGHHKYCYIRTINLLYDFNIICKGAFNYFTYDIQKNEAMFLTNGKSNFAKGLVIEF